MPGGRVDQVGRFGPTGGSPRARAACWGSADVGDKRGEREPDHGEHKQRGEQSADTAVHARFLLSRVVVGACPTSSPFVMEPGHGVVTWSSSRVDIWLFRSAGILLRLTHERPRGRLTCCRAATRPFRESAFSFIEYTKCRITSTPRTHRGITGSAALMQ